MFLTWLNKRRFDASRPASGRLPAKNGHSYSAGTIDLNCEIISGDNPAPTNTVQVRLTRAKPGAVMMRSSSRRIQFRVLSLSENPDAPPCASIGERLPQSNEA